MAKRITILTVITLLWACSAESAALTGWGGGFEIAKSGTETSSVTVNGARVAGKVGAAVVFAGSDNLHYYASKKTAAGGFNLQVSAQAAGVRFGEAVFPEWKFFRDPAGGDVEVYAGKFTVFVPIESYDKNLGKIDLKVIIEGIVCTDKVCLPPFTHEVDATLDFEKIDSWPRIEFKAAAIQPETDDAVTEPQSPVKIADTQGAKTIIADYVPVEFADMKIGPGDLLKPLLLALIAGALLNVMPCVLPVIPLKVLSIIQQSHADVEAGDRYKPVKMAAVFSLGIIAVFIALGLVMSIFKMFYGQQFQSSAFKLVMLFVIYLLTLSMFGLFDVVMPGRISNIRIVKSGYLGAFGMGTLATLLATPCSAPLLGPVLTWSLSRPTAITVMVFFVIGLGMAAPYVLLTAFPKLLNKLPKPGNWMIHLKHALAFIMLGVCVYIIFLFNPGWHMPLIAFCIITAFATWLSFSVVNLNSPPKQRTLARLVAVAVVILGVAMLVRTRPAPQANARVVNWLATRLNSLHEQGKTVMVEFTADWCPNCAYVEKTVLDRKAFKNKLLETDTELIIADWTHSDPAITEMLTILGSKSIPFAAVFPGDNPLQPIVVRDIYRLDTILKVLDEAN